MVFWVFGHGSLVWNLGFECDEKVTGFIKDYARVFDLEALLKILQGLAPRSTLKEPFVEVAADMGCCLLCTGQSQKGKSSDGGSVSPAALLTGVTVFTSTPDKVSNKYYLGPAPMEESAGQIATAVGPCGNNRDYLFLLEKAMFDIGHEDDMVIELANEVRKVLTALGKGISKDKKLLASALIPLKSQTHIPSIQLRLLPDAVAAFP